MNKGIEAFNSIFISVCCVFFLGSCSNQVTSIELDSYLQNEQNGTKKTVESGDFKATIVYRPSDLLVKQEFDGGNKNIETLRKKYSLYSYFVLNLQNKGGDFLNSIAPNRALFAAVNEQLSFHLNETIYIVNENFDTAYLADFTFPRLYEASRASSVLLVFKASDIKSDKFKICVRDLASSVSNLEFEFNKKDFNNIPSIKI